MNIQSGLIFVGESSAWLWAWSSDDVLTKSQLVMAVNGDAALITGGDASFEIDVDAYNQVCDGKLPPTNPIGEGVLSGQTFTLWVQKDKESGALVEDRLVVWPTKAKVNGLRRK